MRVGAALVLVVVGIYVVGSMGRAPASVGRTDRGFTRLVDAVRPPAQPTRRACHAARRAVTYYAAVLDRWSRMTGERAGRLRSVGPCPLYRAHVLRVKAIAARARARRWLRENYDWRSFMPAKWRRVGACETGYGREPGSFSWDSGTYVSFAGIYRPGYDQHAAYIGLRGWDQTKRELGRLPTPREQLRVAEEIQRRYGFGAWGCGGA